MAYLTAQRSLHKAYYSAPVHPIELFGPQQAFGGVGFTRGLYGALAGSYGARPNERSAVPILRTDHAFAVTACGEPSLRRSAAECPRSRG